MINTTWSIQSNEIEASRIFHYQIKEGNKLLTGQQVIDLMIGSSGFRTFLAEVLKNSPFKAYFWEVRPFNTSSLAEDFEFVMVDSQRLSEKKAKPAAFREHFDKAQSDIVAFRNLSGDALLVVPCPLVEHQHYTHLANFVRNAPKQQIDALLKQVGEGYREMLGADWKWLSTAGLGVYWLHVRIDSRPKYYRYKPYKEYA